MLRNALKNSGFEIGELPVSAHILLEEFTAGSKAKRIMVGFGLGRSTVAGRLVFLDAEKKELANVPLKVRGISCSAPTRAEAAAQAGDIELRTEAARGDRPPEVMRLPARFGGRVGGLRSDCPRRPPRIPQTARAIEEVALERGLRRRITPSDENSVRAARYRRLTALIICSSVSAGAFGSGRRDRMLGAPRVRVTSADVEHNRPVRTARTKLKT